MAECPSLNQFYDVVKKEGILLTNRYKLTIQLPTDGMNATINQAIATLPLADATPVSFNANNTIANITIWAKGAKLPNRTQNTVEFKYQGYPLQYPSNFVYEQEFSIDLRSDEKLSLRNLFLAWQDAMSAADFYDDKDWGRAGGGRKTISNARVFITVYNQSMQTALHTYILEGVFPTGIGNIEFTNEDPDIASYTVDFKTQYWTVSHGDTDRALGLSL